MASEIPKALLLGMVYSLEQTPKRGQEFRDRVRCESLEKNGHEVYTLDNKHGDSMGSKVKSGRHCTTNFSDTRRMIRSMKDAWGADVRFSYIILDYFFSPISWARERWTEDFYYKTLPALATNYLAPNGRIILPNLGCVKELIDSQYSHLSIWFRIELLEIAERNLNPLYFATETVERELLKCPDNLTNETQMKPLYDFSNSPFYVLTCINHTAPCTPPSHRLQRANGKDLSSYSSSSSSTSQTTDSRIRNAAAKKRFASSDLESPSSVSERLQRINRRALLRDLNASTAESLSVQALTARE